MKTKVVIALVFTALLLSLAIVPAAMASDPEPGTAPASSFATSVSSSLAPVVTETGKITLSLDAAGSNDASSTIQVEKPSAGATVRAAYMMAASIYGGYGGGQIADGDITIDGTAISWDVETSNVLSSYNYWTDATALVKAKIDAAPAGLVDFTLVEVNRNSYVDGEILAVIFDDPAQAASNTVVLCFGSQNQEGDTFAIGLAEPIDKSDPDLVLDFSLGISYSHQGINQYSVVDVNGERLSTSAGGEDDGYDANGALITVGGLDDSNANPADPNATPNGDPRYDDELYSLLPFVEDGDTSITVYTENPSDDDNLMFAGLFLGGATAVVGEGIVLSPAEAINPVGTDHTVTAKVQDNAGAPIPGVSVTFSVIAGPNEGLTGDVLTDANGEAEWTYTSNGEEGTDTIQACSNLVASATDVPVVCSNEVTKTWQGSEPPIPELSTIVLFGIGLLMLGGVMVLVRRKVSAA